jgi:hypothetical protein
MKYHISLQFYCVAYKRDKGAYLECHIRNQEENRGKQIL